MRVVLLVAFASSLSAQAVTPAPDSAHATGSLVDRAAGQYRAAHSVRATFEQTLKIPGAAAAQAARGEYFQGTGSRFALRFSEPLGDAIVNDGTAIWLYVPSSAKGQVIKMPAEAGAGLDVLSELLAAPKTNYVVVRIRDEQVDSHPTTVFALSPKTADLPFTRATLWIGKADGLIWQLETAEQGGAVRLVRFTAVHIDVELPPDALRFTVPPGVKVIDQSAFFVGKSRSRFARGGLRDSNGRRAASAPRSERQRGRRAEEVELTPCSRRTASMTTGSSSTARRCAPSTPNACCAISVPTTRSMASCASS